MTSFMEPDRSYLPTMCWPHCVSVDELENRQCLAVYSRRGFTVSSEYTAERRKQTA